MVIHSVSMCVFSTGAVGWGRAGRYKYIGKGLFSLDNVRTP